MRLTKEEDEDDEEEERSKDIIDDLLETPALAVMIIYVVKPSFLLYMTEMSRYVTSHSFP